MREGLNQQQQHLAPTPAECPPIGCALAPHLPGLDQCEQPVVACDLASAQRCLSDWSARFPGVHASTSAQALGSRPLTRLLAASGRVSFRAYSKADLDAAVSAGVPGHAILLANPCKTRRLAGHARRLGVGVAVFDSEPELVRLATVWPEVELLLLLAASPRCHRLGARPEEAPRLLAAARRCGLRVAGVAVWLGDDCDGDGDDGIDANVEWTSAAAAACGTLALARRLGHQNADVVDLGCLSAGALAGRALPALAEASDAALVNFERRQPRLICDLTPALLAESVVMATRVLAKAEAADQSVPGGYSYRLSGPGLGGQLCGLFNRLDGGSCGGVGVPSLLADCGSDPLNLLLPELSVGDWLLWRGMRACPTAARLMHCLFSGELMDTKTAACLEEEPLPAA